MYRAAVCQLGFGSAIAPSYGVSYNGAAKPM